jgi:hypothetical protein
MSYVCKTAYLIASALLSLVALDVANARVTTSKVLCSCTSPSGPAGTNKELERMVLESRNIGKVVGVVITSVSTDVASISMRDNLRRSSLSLLATLRELGIKSAEGSIEFLEASPSDYGCKGAELAVNVEFIYEHR